MLIDICENVVINVASLAKAKNITIHSLAAEKLYIRADINVFKIVLRNLLTNAIKFSHKDSEIYVHADIRNGMAEVTVSDFGIGMDEEQIVNIWDIEKEQSRRGTAQERGSGFGLTLCKDLIESHNGKIWVTSKKDEGSNFTFALPLNSIDD